MKNLLYPLSENDFFLEYWQQKPYFSLDGEYRNNDLPALMSLKDMEFLVSSLSSVQDGWIELVKSSSILDKKKYINESSFIDLARVCQAYAQGYSLLLTKVNKRLPSISVLCREYEKLFFRNHILLSSQVRASVVLTPKLAKGFPIHYDDCEVFALQVTGEKLWTVYNAPNRYPSTKRVPQSLLQIKKQNSKYSESL